MPPASDVLAGWPATTVLSCATCFNPPPLLRAVGRRISVLCRRSSARFQPTHRSFERWDAGEGDADAWRPPVSTHPPLLRAVGHPGALVGRPQRRCFNPPTAPSSGGTWST